MSDEMTKVALITGACGGIGRALVFKYVSQGISLAIADKSLNEVTILVDEVVRKGGTAKAFSGDLTQQSYCDNLPNDVKQAFGRIDILVNNAGLMRRGAITDTTDEDYNLSGSGMVAGSNVGAGTGGVNYSGPMNKGGLATRRKTKGK